MSHRVNLCTRVFLHGLEQVYSFPGLGQAHPLSVSCIRHCLGCSALGIVFGVMEKLSCSVGHVHPLSVSCIRHCLGCSAPGIVFGVMEKVSCFVCLEQTFPSCPSSQIFTLLAWSGHRIFLWYFGKRHLSCAFCKQESPFRGLLHLRPFHILDVEIIFPWSTCASLSYSGCWSLLSVFWNRHLFCAFCEQDILSVVCYMCVLFVFWM